MIVEDCKTLVSEAADKAVQRSLSAPQKTDQVTDLDASSLNDVVEHAEIVDQRKSGSVQSINEIGVSTNPDGEESVTVVTELADSEDKTPVTDIINGDVNTEEDGTFELINADDSVNEIDFEQNNKDKGEKGKKKKNKKKELNNIEKAVIETVNGQIQKELTEAENHKVEKKISKGNIFTNMFKFSRKKKTNTEGTHEVKNVNGVAEVPAGSSTEMIDENKPSTSANGTSDRVTAVKRLDSLDSGIVEPQVDIVEYAVVQKKKNVDTEIKPVVDNAANPVVGQRLAESEPLYINGEQTDEDFVYINERAVDVDGLNKDDVPVIVAASPGVDGALNDEDKKPSDEERQSDVSSDSGTGMGTTPSPVATPDKVKLKKKTWSFQFGKKKNSTKNKDVESSPVSMDPAASPVEGKKPRWRFGKFSFRKSTSDMSVSTPNLHQTDIPEEEESTTSPGKQKKRSKLKLPRLRKDKKKDVNVEPDAASLDMRSASLTDLDMADSSPMSRKSKLLFWNYHFVTSGYANFIVFTQVLQIVT